MTKLEEAIRLREAGRHAEAQTLLLGLVREEPLVPSNWYQCAWIHDAMGLEKEAAPFYAKALELGLADEERRGAWLGLGSTYRTLGEYESARTCFRQAIREYPEAREFQVFYAMTLYNLGEHAQAMELMLRQLGETSGDEGIASYKKAILFYADKLDRVWK
ncbi:MULTISPECIES: tetratricopeptide repeat protein [Paenibacillus]|uniref:tetratricopeptide repeat protein n=1 Tax=Paenibacillus TaxID=44249 RepID=UPI00020D7260|nr:MULTISPECIES: tetratricopeptide repeat protein [Paenibacillus]EGL17551.1 tetratricopeptide repeat protein [Paenibacillus sp. HGF7]EPD90346.1 hypothetical protein HMPREF1207_01132 [Paenibacillus sp. HGH0039]MBV6712529.1 tetratricopeptide repeat protein [Paenibacillus chitinolyticus]